ncbi:hypothetical protein [Devosia aurantiaca]|uniref:Phage-related protein n=1 Tax=Devosia aurantiaca TaxID=2714858 RepID=A0A6M1SVW7_9HYPH|nr:hypothetical protein [Devosia aurantiaca]NGP19155.1 hypothetical protein [Devosia aurantiaca]
MADRPILFSGPMVRALLAGTKTQTRRALNPQPFLEDGSWKVQWGKVLRCWQEGRNPQIIPNWLRISVGDRLYVREHWFTWGIFDDLAPSKLTGTEGVSYIADGHEGPRAGRFRQGMHMPRWASRLTLKVTDVRVERLQDCSEADAIAEGVEQYSSSIKLSHPFNPDWKGIYREGYAELWNSINGAGAWEANPWVAAYTFTVVRENIDQIGKAA